MDNNKFDLNSIDDLQENLVVPDLNDTVTPVKPKESKSLSMDEEALTQLIGDNDTPPTLEDDNRQLSRDLAEAGMSLKDDKESTEVNSDDDRTIVYRKNIDYIMHFKPTKKGLISGGPIIKIDDTQRVYLSKALGKGAPTLYEFEDALRNLGVSDIPGKFIYLLQCDDKSLILKSQNNIESYSKLLMLAFYANSSCDNFLVRQIAKAKEIHMICLDTEYTKDSIAYYCGYFDSINPDYSVDVTLNMEYQHFSTYYKGLLDGGNYGTYVKMMLMFGNLVCPESLSILEKRLYYRDDISKCRVISKEEFLSLVDEIEAKYPRKKLDMNALQKATQEYIKKTKVDPNAENHQLPIDEDAEDKLKQTETVDVPNTADADTQKLVDLLNNSNVEEIE